MAADLSRIQTIETTWLLRGKDEATERPETAQPIIRKNAFHSRAVQVSFGIVMRASILEKQRMFTRVMIGYKIQNDPKLS